MVRNDGGWTEYSDLDVPRNQVVDGLAGSAVWHVLQLYSRGLRKPFAEEVLVCARSRSRVTDARLTLGCGDQLRNRSHAQRGMNGNDLSGADQKTDWYECLHVISIEFHDVWSA